MCCSLPRGSTSMLLGFTNFKAHVYLATSSVTQIKPPDDSSNTNNPPPLPAVRTHLVHICTHAYIHIHRHIHAPHLRVSHQVYTSMLQKWDSTFFFIMKLLLFLWELSKKSRFPANGGWCMVQIQSQTFQSLRQFSRESHRNELSDESVLRTIMEHNLKNMPGKQPYRNRKPK